MMKTNPTEIEPVEELVVTIRSKHQALAERLVKDTVVGANAMADMIAFLDASCVICEMEDGELPFGVISGIRAMLHNRHGLRTLQRVLLVLLEEGLVDRRLALGLTQPYYVLDVAEFYGRLNRAAEEDGRE